MGAYLYQFLGLLEVLTFATIGLEAFGSFLLLFPFFAGPMRSGGVLAFMGLHWLCTKSRGLTLEVAVRF